MSDAQGAWVLKESRKHAGRFYYFNTTTKESRWERPSDFTDKEQVRCSHILVKHEQSRRPYSWRKPEEKITRTKQEAIDILNGCLEMLQAGENFGDLAASESDCSSAKRNGDLGKFGRGEMQKAFEEAAFALPVGGLSGIVETESGVHVILRSA
mmetsp:Transcript_43507/g.109811  ORF Transcript_43507/g.109811 Transcript_43507/m.109811 type:complete len:154 (-) Transcript_43507:70-531(-)